MSCERLAKKVLLATVYTHGKAAQPQRSSKDRWRDYISDLACSRLGVEPAELSEITVDREVFRVLLGLLPPAALPKGKAGTKMSG